MLQVALPVATGYSSKYINAGNIQNKGFEFVVTGKPISGKDFNWDIAFNFGLNRSLVKELSPEVKIFYLGGGFGRSATPVVQEGKAYGDLLAFKWQNRCQRKSRSYSRRETSVDSRSAVHRQLLSKREPGIDKHTYLQTFFIARLG
jgi:hypothetical protein